MKNGSEIKSTDRVRRMLHGAAFFILHSSFFILFSLFFILYSSFSILDAHAQDPVKLHGRLQVRGTQLCDQRGQQLALHGVSLGWHNWWPRFYNKKAVQTLKKQWHATVIRAAIGVTEEGGYIDNPSQAMQCLTAVVEAAIKQNVYVIVDWHSHEMRTAEAKSFFGEVARRWGRHPNIIYEIYNEPVEDTWASLKEYAAEVIGEIRRYDPDNIILMGCPHWNQDIHLVADSPLQGYNNIMYTVHFYAATHGNSLRERTEDAISRGVPVFISECGAMEADGDGETDIESNRQWMDMCRRLGVSWLYWSISDKEETCSMLTAKAKSTGPWRDDVITPYGRMVKAMLGN